MLANQSKIKQNKTPSPIKITNDSSINNKPTSQGTE